MTQPNLLLIEDNPRDVRLLQIALSEMSGFPHRLEAASTLTEGIARLRKGGVDLVLLDLGLPESQGTDTLVRLQKEVADVPIVVLTGLADEEVATEAARMGAQDYLVKGKMYGELLSRTLRYAIERHRILMELRRALRQR